MMAKEQNSRFRRLRLFIRREIQRMSAPFQETPHEFRTDQATGWNEFLYLCAFIIALLLTFIVDASSEVRNRLARVTGRRFSRPKMHSNTESPSDRDHVCQAPV